MKLYVKNKFFSIGGGSSATDENGKDVFIIKGRPFSPTKVKKIYDLNNNLLYKVRNKFWNNPFSFKGPKILVFNGAGEEVAILRKPKVFTANFEIESTLGNFSVEGQGFLTGQFIVKQNNEEIAVIEKLINLAVDSFELIVHNEQYASLMLAFLICMDNFYDKLSDSKR